MKYKTIIVKCKTILVKFKTISYNDFTNKWYFQRKLTQSTSILKQSGLNLKQSHVNLKQLYVNLKQLCVNLKQSYVNLKQSLSKFKTIIWQFKTIFSEIYCFKFQMSPRLVLKSICGLKSNLTPDLSLLEIGGHTDPIIFVNKKSKNPFSIF